MKSIFISILLLSGTFPLQSQHHDRSGNDRNGHRSSEGTRLESRGNYNRSSYTTSSRPGRDFNTYRHDNPTSSYSHDYRGNKTEMIGHHRQDYAYNNERGGYDRYQVRHENPGYRSHADYNRYRPFERNRIHRGFEYREHYYRPYRVLPFGHGGYKYIYHRPYRNEFIWSLAFAQNFGFFYPEVRYLRYPVGQRILSIPAYNADSYIGEVASIYGDISDSYYAQETDEYVFYFGDAYPNQFFSISVPGVEARKFDVNPEQYFAGQHMIVTGYITWFEGKPFVQVHQSSQLEVY